MQARLVYEAFRESMLAKNDDWTKLISENVKISGPLVAAEGKEAFIQINTPFFQSIKSSEVNRIVESENLIITQITTTIHLPTREITLTVSEWYEISNGLIQSLTTYFDTDELRKAM